MALTPGGVLYSWGDNASGQLGRGNIGPTGMPKRVLRFHAALNTMHVLPRVKQVACGAQHRERDNVVYWKTNRKIINDRTT